MNMKRMRGRNHRSGGGGGGGGGGTALRHHTGNIPLNRNHVFDSSGPDLRIRGTAQQLFEKYLQLGRDATSSGDRVMAESYFQHAEHYFRILNAMAQAAQQGQPNGQGQGQNQGQPQNQGQYQPSNGGYQNGGGSQNSQGQANHQRRTSALDMQNEQMDDYQSDPLVPQNGNGNDDRDDRRHDPQDPSDA
jgi:hypothetical protein